MKKLLKLFLLCLLCNSGMAQWIDGDPIETDAEKSVRINGRLSKLEFFDSGPQNQVEASVGIRANGLELKSPTAGIIYDAETEHLFQINGSTKAYIKSDGDFRFNSNNNIIEWHNGSLVGQIGLLTSTMRIENYMPNGKMILTAFDDFSIFSHGNVAFHVNDNLKIGIGTVFPTQELQVIGNLDITGEMTAASDLRLKKDISPILNALDKILKLNPVSYHFKQEEFKELKLASGKKMGLIAQEVESVLPDLVNAGSKLATDSGEENFLSVNYIELIPLMIQAIKEMSIQLEEKEAAIQSLKKKFK